jgi:hypothetical protein
MKNKVINSAPKNWLTKTGILSKIKDMPVYVTKRLEELSISQPKFYGIFVRHGVNREFYSPEIFLKIQEEVQERMRQKKEMKGIERTAQNRKHLRLSSYGSYASSSLAKKQDGSGSLDFDD